MSHAAAALEDHQPSARIGLATSSPPAWYEAALALGGFLVIFGTFKSMLLSGTGARTDGSALFQLTAGCIYLASILLLLLRGTPTWTFAVLLRAWPLVLLTLLAVVSTLWSQEPATTLRRSLALTLSTMFMIYIVVRFDLRTMFNLMAIAFGVFCVVGILSAGVPGLGITPSGTYAGALRGLTGNKNVFGRTIAVGVALMPLAALLDFVALRRLVLALSPVAVALLILSRSATSFVTAFASVAVGAVLYFALGGRIGRVRLRPELGLPVLAITGIIGFFTVFYGWTAILEELGRDPTLTGRTKLWSWAIDLNEDRKWLGSGYRTFWIDENTLYFSEFFWWGQDADGNRSDTNRGPTHSHSGYVDTYLNLGFLGVASLAILILSSLAAIRRVVSVGDNKLGLMFSVTLSFLLIYAITEQSILQQSEDLWCIFAMLYLYVMKEITLRRQAPAGLPGFDRYAALPGTT